MGQKHLIIISNIIEQNY